LGILCTMCVLISCSSNKTSLPSLRQTFYKEDNLPFGTKVAYKLVQEVYSENDIQQLKTENDLANYSYDDTASLYICIAKNVYVSKDDAGSILNYVNAGNTYFISAENISDELLDTLGVTLDNIDAYNNDWSAIKNTDLTMDASISKDRSAYGYFFLPFLNSFSKYDSAFTKVLGSNEEGHPDFIVVFYGKGKIFLHCAPGAFSNYFLLQHSNYQYLQDVLALMPPSPQHIYWDDYYCKHNNPASAKNGLSVLFQYPAMKWAFWLALILLLLYIIFGGKRKQRIVPILSPMKNTTVAYTETVSRLYLQKKDNKNIAEKMITYFLEYIRNQFFLNTNQLNDEFIDTLSRKSSVPKETTAALFKMITDIQEQASVNDQQLLLLNKQIENFYKNRK
jgi:uncharacterized protein DUF4350